MPALFAGGVLFLSAGSWRYWEAWAYCALLFVPTLATGLYFLARDPALQERRMRWWEKEREQRLSRLTIGGLILLGRTLAGLDHRYHWSEAPVALVAAAGAGMLGVFLLQFRIFQENHYAGATVEVEAEQKVISSGPYAVVRHPMYLSALLLFLCTPLVLGSYWSVLAFLPIPFGLVLRIRNEEAVLTRELPGYAEYSCRVRWRLLPGVW